MGHGEGGDGPEEALVVRLGEGEVNPGGLPRAVGPLQALGPAHPGPVQEAGEEAEGGHHPDEAPLLVGPGGRGEGVALGEELPEEGFEVPGLQPGPPPPLPLEEEEEGLHGHAVHVIPLAPPPPDEGLHARHQDPAVPPLQGLLDQGLAPLGVVPGVQAQPGVFPNCAHRSSS